MTLDIHGAMQRLGNDVALFQEFIGFYQEDCPRILGSLETAVVAQDAEGVHNAAHSLKGLVASLGATDVAAQAAALERSSRAGDLSDAPEGFAKLLTEIERLNQELAAFRENAKN